MRYKEYDNENKIKITICCTNGECEKEFDAYIIRSCTEDVNDDNKGFCSYIDEGEVVCTHCQNGFIYADEWSEHDETGDMG